jgi:hypothetical protein
MKSLPAGSKKGNEYEILIYPAKTIPVKIA